MQTESSDVYGGQLFGLMMSWMAKKGLDATLKRFLDWYNDPTPRQILIAGPGGVGKSTLGSFFSASPGTTAFPSGNYEESIGVEKYAFGDDPKVKIVVPPGQAHRIEPTWTNQFEQLRNGEFRGVIFVLAYGHHTLGDISYQNHKLYDGTKGFDAFVADYLEGCREEEDRLLRLICTEIKKCSRPIWLLTLVTKQDLWWDQNRLVFDHYTGKNKRINRDCLGSKEAKDFRHETAFVSLVIRNLVSGRNEVLKPTASGYDQKQQAESLEKMVQVFTGLMDWERSHAGS